LAAVAEDTQPFMPMRLALFTLGFLVLMLILTGLGAMLVSADPAVLLPVAAYGLPLAGLLYPPCFILAALVWYGLRRAGLRRRFPAGWKPVYGGVAAFAIVGLAVLLFGPGGAGRLGLGSAEAAGRLVITMAAVSGVAASMWVFRHD
jgi:hypothetical protein